MPFKNFVSAIVLFLWVQQAYADGFTPIDLEPIEHKTASLTVARLDGSESVYNPARLEELPTYRLVTRTPWRDTPAAFDGILLSDFLVANGLERAPAIRITAENDFSTVIDRALFDSVKILIATRVDGKAHTHRARGPIQFVLAETDYLQSPLTEEANYVWMAARIEAYF